MICHIVVFFTFMLIIFANDRFRRLWDNIDNEFELIDGDILIKKNHMNGLTHENFMERYDNPYRLWPNGIIPYIFGYEYEINEINEIKKAMMDIESKTCIKFHERKP